MKQIQLKISTPSEPIRPGRGFYQLEEDALFVQVSLFTERKHFFNYLENEKLQFDLDREGNLIFIEVDYPRRHWEIDEKLKAPARAEAAEIKWLHFREELPDAKFLTNQNKSILKLEFSKSKSPLFYYLADSVIAETDKNNHLTAIWVTEITDDFAGKEIAEFRQEHRIAKSYFL